MNYFERHCFILSDSFHLLISKEKQKQPINLILYNNSKNEVNISKTKIVGYVDTILKVSFKLHDF